MWLAVPFYLLFKVLDYYLLFAFYLLDSSLLIDCWIFLISNDGKQEILFLNS